LCLEKQSPPPGPDESRGAPDRLLSVKQVAERLGVATAIVYSLCGDGRLAHVRILNVIRIAPSDLSAFIESCRSPVSGPEYEPPESSLHDRAAVFLVHSA
jgi:excisionase family DNA binding protein